VKKIVKICPVNPEIICLKLKKKEINASKISIPVGKFSEWAKQGNEAQYILPFGCHHASDVSPPTCATWLTVTHANQHKLVRRNVTPVH